MTMRTLLTRADEASGERAKAAAESGIGQRNRVGDGTIEVVATGQDGIDLLRAYCVGTDLEVADVAGYATWLTREAAAAISRGIDPTLVVHGAIVRALFGGYHARRIETEDRQADQ